MPRSDTVYLQHILEAIKRIEEYLQGITEIDFHNRYLIQDGVIRQIEIIGEATKQLSKETRKNNPHIPWSDIVGMRDKLIHHYFGVDLEQVWLTAQDDLPMLKQEVDRIVKLTENE
jgi:uncharacterized protein with HEPN domain